MRTATRVIGSRAVRDIMQPQVVAVVPEMTVRELAQTLLDETVHGAPVVSSTGKILGVVSMTDVVRLAAEEAEIPAGQVSWGPVALPEEENTALDEPVSRVGFTALDPGSPVERTFDDYRVADIMTPVAFSVGPDDSIVDLLRFFLRGRVHRALVVEEGRLLGIVTPFDVLGLLEQELV